MQRFWRPYSPDHVRAVSDASFAAGWPDGTRFLSYGLKAEVRSGVARLMDRTSFAGSTTLLNQMIAILVNEAGFPLAEAVRMASPISGRIIGQDRRKGSLETGKDADLAVLDDDFTAVATMIAGQWVFPVCPIF
jgi:N-acetylglucosamine-6-phosphate deacetylase